ncbi:MAG: 2-oxo acid dehydrogenase subunit E2 [Firmicutes bacterium]|nr:2-oxo acid dehydrogenase subunit E2 [Bacillota bacterium]
MATQVTMPKLGMTMEEGTVTKWFKAEGEPVQEGEPLLSVLTDKVDIEVEAPASGVLRKILVGPDTTVPINTPIAIIAAADEDISALLPAAGSPPQGPAESTAAGGKAPDGSGLAEILQAEAGAPEERAQTGGGGRVRATPVARRMARELGLDLAAVPGSGPRGRVTRADVEEYAARTGLGTAGVQKASKTPSAESSAEPAAVAGGASSASPATAPGGVSPVPRRVPISPMRRAIAQRMTKSAFTAPHVTLTTEADVTELVRVRSALNEADRNRGGDGISYVDLFVRIAARALADHPYLNARLEGDEIVLEPEAHIGIAVAVPGGLLVPVIRRAGSLGIQAVARKRRRLVEAARRGELSPDEMRGGTFTISNLGAYGIDAFTPIINAPETAILGLGRIVEKPVIRDGQVCARSMMVLSLSFDHRVVDGVPAAEFLRQIAELSQRPELLLL